MEKDKEIERLKDDNKYLNKINIELASKNQRLNNILKEIREYIDSITWNTSVSNIQDNIWYILDKVEKINE